jgi:biotin synthase-related radical SAM superfamily protein
MCGVVVDPHDGEFFKDFMSGADNNASWNKRMKVLTTAKHMIGKGEYTP